jgi:hypothetical protein
MPNTVFSFHTDDDPLASSLIAFLQGDPQIREELPRLIHAKLVSSARRLVPSELAEDAVQQMWLLLLRKRPDSFDPSRVSTWKYLQQLLRTAARDVRTSYTPPGHRTRPRKDADGKIIKNNRVLSLDSALSSEDDDDAENTLYELIADTQDPFDTIDAKLDAEMLLTEMESFVSQPIVAALEWMYDNDARLEESAKHFGLTRFQLHRGIQRLRCRYELLPLAI